MLSLKKALSSAFFVVCLSATSAAAECLPQGESVDIAIERVVDGDTVKLRNGRSVRLLGINTPELNLGKGAPEPYATQARDELRRLTQRAQARLLLGPEFEDRYKRLLGHLLIDDVNAAEHLIGLGLGWAVAVEPNVDQADCLFAAESLARAKALGVWREPVVEAASINGGGFALVQGVVTRIDATPKYIYVELDEHLALRVTRKQLSAEEAVRISTILGEQVEARGWIIDRRKQLNSESRFKPFMLPITSSWHLRLLE